MVGNDPTLFPDMDESVRESERRAARRYNDRHETLTGREVGRRLKLLHAVDELPDLDGPATEQAELTAFAD